MRQNSSGFTLIEVMIVVAIVGILAMVAGPAYTSYVTKSKRGDGKAALLQIMQLQEKFRASCPFYGTTISTTADLCGAVLADTTLKAATTSVDGHYNIALSAVTGSAYTVTASPTFTDAECTALIIDQDGAQSSTGSLTGTACWK